MNRLKEAILSITNRCSLRCRMCDIPLVKTEELETRQWKEIIRGIGDCGAQTVVLSGGEPLLRGDIFELIECVRRRRMSACVTTNGVLLDENAARQMASAGVNVVNVSLDGAEEAHDFLRGPGTFQQAVAALAILRKYGIETTIAMMTGRHNLKFMPGVIELAHKHRVTTVRFQPFSRIFLRNPVPEREAEFWLTAEEREAAEALMEDTLVKAKAYNIAVNPANYLRRIPGYLSGKETAPVNGCAALWASCPVNARGEIFPCWVLTQEDMLIGNAGREEFSRVWGAERHEHIRRRISENGCPGCLMSCYDGIYGRDEWPLRLRRKIQALTGEKTAEKILDRTIQNLKAKTHPWRSRYSFYRSYGGPWQQVFRRAARKRLRPEYSGDSDAGLRQSLLELENAKEKLQEAIRRAA